jgi:GT2 family glycosyltransferase
MISIIIVNWNSGNQLYEVIKSINENDLKLISSLIIVDNASIDDSLLKINSLENNVFPIYIIKNTENKGFGTACNQGAKLSTSDYLLFLNPDTRLFANSLSIPFTYMQHIKNADVGICGIQLIDETGHVSRTCARFPSVRIFIAQILGLSKLSSFKTLGQHMGEWDHNTNREVDQVIGAFFFIRHSIFKALNGFDERYFVYFEEVDVSYRARLAGWRSVYIASAQAFHAGGGTSSQVKAHRLFYSLRSRLLYGFKHFSPSRAWTLMVVTLLVEPITRSVFSLLRGGFTDLRNTLKGYGMLWREVPAILKGKKL